MNWFEIVWPREEGRAETCPEVKQGRMGVEGGSRRGVQGWGGACLSLFTLLVGVWWDGRRHGSPW